MKIKNEYVEIKIGNKVYKKQNMILNTYLKKIFQSQLDTEHSTCELSSCFIKLDTPIEDVTYNSELTRDDFDIQIVSSVNLEKDLITTKNTAKIKYSFKDILFFYKKNDETWASSSGGTSFNMFNGRKITAIGFGIVNNCMTFLDTNNMNIIINNTEKFIFTRVDNIMSDGITYKMDYPLHLINDIARKDKKTVNVNDFSYEETTMAQLYSVGFGNTLGLMEEEYLINDVETDRDNYSITFDVSRIKKLGHYPSEDLQLGFYPTMDNSKYLIFKYRLYRRYYNSSTSQYVITYLDEYYTMSKPNENFGNLEIKLKIERS